MHLADPVTKPPAPCLLRCAVRAVQMAVPQLRSPVGLRSFNADLAGCEYDLDLWRRSTPRGRQCNFALLDRNGGAGWELACKLVCPRDDFNRGRLSAAAALRHRYFRGD
jgi:hypothetical protein